MNTIKIFAPRLNTNDDELIVLEIYIKKGQSIKKGEKICSVETSKASIDIESEYNGKIKDIHINIDKYINVGDVICTLLTNEIGHEIRDTDLEIQNTNKNINISLKAQKLIDKYNIDISDINPVNGEIKTKQILDYVENNIQNSSKINDTKSIIIGTGLHSKDILNILETEQIKILGFCSESADQIDKSIIGNYIVVCSDDNIFEIDNIKNLNIFIGVGGTISNENRKKIFNILSQRGLNLPSLISSKAIVSKYSLIGKGTIIMPGAIIGPEVSIGENCIINHNSVVSHGCKIGSHVHLTPSSVIAGNCVIGDMTTIGMGATILNGITVGKNCLIHNNSSVTVNLMDQTEINQNGKIYERKV